MYTKTRWELRVRKEVFSPLESLENPKIVHLIFSQIIREISTGTTLRLTLPEINQIRALLSEYGITENNVNATAHKLQTKKTIIQQCKEFPNYFSRIFPVSGGRHHPNAEMLGVSHSGLRLLRKVSDTNHDHLEVLETIPLEEVADVNLAKVSTVQLLLRNGGCLTLYSPKAPHIHAIIDQFSQEALQETGIEFVRAVADYETSEESLLSFRSGDIIRILKSSNVNVAKGISRFPKPEEGD